ncbi:MAG TPA: hypothetical protein VLX68_16450 [Chitinivibrionales bacterium]|nr:hypothetical protein [Chitinivibrionales bacterium]
MKIIKYFPVLLAAGLAAFFCYFPITDTDIFWHLAAGREIIAQRHLLYTDPFAFTLASPRWIDLHWLFQLLVYGLFLLGGLKALIVFKLAAVAGTVTLLCLAYRSGVYAWACSLLSALLFYDARYLVCERPVLITMLCIAAYIFLFENVRRGLNKRWLWLCVPLQMIWTNSQGLYPIGLFIIGAYAAEEVVGSARAAALSTDKPGSVLWNSHSLVLVLCLLSCLVNPYGISGLLLPFKLFSRIAPVAQNLYSLTISENVPLFSLTGFEAGYRTAVMVTAVAAIALFAVNWKKIRPAHAVLFLGFLFLAVSAVRNVLLYFIAVVPIVGYIVMDADGLHRFSFLPQKARHLASAGVAAASLLLVVVPFINHYAVVAACPPGRVLSPFRFPEKIAAYLKADPVPGEMFNDIRYGGYLIWELYPRQKVFIDGRLVIRQPRFFAEYLSVCATPELFSFLEKKFNITHAILPSAIFTQYRNLIKWLCENPDWHLEYTDGSSFLLVKNSGSKRPAIDLSDPKTADAVADSIRVQWKGAPYVRQEALGYFTEMLRYMGMETSAQTVEKKTEVPEQR